MFPRYEIGDIVMAISKRNSWQEHHLILDKKFTATQRNMADIYVTLCLDNNIICDQTLQESVHCTFRKVA